MKLYVWKSKLLGRWIFQVGPPGREHPWALRSAGESVGQPLRPARLATSHGEAIVRGLAELERL